jgi:hypothetical protein
VLPTGSDSVRALADARSRELGVATQFAGRLALLVFAASAAERLWSPHDLSSALSTVLVHTAVFYGFGLICGELARRLVEEDATREFEAWKAASELVES